MKEKFTWADCDIIHETSSAVLVKKNDDEFWFPFSHVERIVRSKEPGKSQIVVTAWIAKKKGLL